MKFPKDSKQIVNSRKIRKFENAFQQSFQIELSNYSQSSDQLGNVGEERLLFESIYLPNFIRENENFGLPNLLK